MSTPILPHGGTPSNTAPFDCITSASLTSIQDLIEWLRLSADRCDRKALANTTNRHEFQRYRRMATAARDLADWYASQAKGGGR